MNESRDPSAAEAALLPDGHHAQALVAELPDWHPVRKLFTGESQWLGRSDAVYVFLRLLCEIYGDFIWPPSATDPKIDPLAEFDRKFPDDVIFGTKRRMQRYSLRSLYAKARASIDAMTVETPARRPAGLAAFDRAFSDLIRSIIST